MTTSRRLLTLAAIAFSGLILSACSDTATETQRDEEGSVTERNDDASVFEIQVGDCYNFPDESANSTEVETLSALPCDQPHQAEAYHEVEIDGDDFPGAPAVEEQADAACLDAFEPFVGAPYDTSVLDFTYLAPTEASWEQLDDRLVSCLIVDTENPEVTGSLQGAAR
ncbi:septum formation family protein [Aeromicrobium sp. Leaf350]|uniref:septum formation family protein n=1 Tax=Aeromicrobium sp. Leaf350 TaxID=2876565 RepID=UPI001E607142|nr:septum formation family protein [Aeromicrobium sp. Leaf350]